MLSFEFELPDGRIIPNTVPAEGALAVADYFFRGATDVILNANTTAFYMTVCNNINVPPETTYDDIGFLSDISRVVIERSTKAQVSAGDPAGWEQVTTPAGVGLRSAIMSIANRGSGASAPFSRLVVTNTNNDSATNRKVLAFSSLLNATPLRLDAGQLFATRMYVVVR